MSDLMLVKKYIRIICMILGSYMWVGDTIAQEVITYSKFEDFSKDSLFLFKGNNWFLAHKSHFKNGNYFMQNDEIKIESWFAIDSW